MQLIELRGCPICTSNATVTVTSAVPTLCRESGHTTELRACKECLHWWHSPVPDQATLCSMYASASPYVVGTELPRPSRRSKSNDLFDEFALRIIRQIGSGAYLEIGAGTGRMLSQVEHLGFECYGVDPGQWAANAAIRRDLSDLPRETVFDVFLLKDVIEHLFDPVDLLSRLRERARSRAILLASFPCSESLPARRLGTRWNMIRPYGHLHYFSRLSAMRLLDRAGWKATDLRLSRTVPLRRLLAGLHLRSFARELLDGGADQLHVYGSV